MGNNPTLYVQSRTRFQLYIKLTQIKIAYTYHVKSNQNNELQPCWSMQNLKYA